MDQGNYFQEVKIKNKNNYFVWQKIFIRDPIKLIFPKALEDKPASAAVAAPGDHHNQSIYSSLKQIALQETSEIVIRIPFGLVELFTISN